jgi:TRAP-type C4-dicarboxylate transport system permease small subunit
MGDIIEWIVRELFQGLFEAIYERLPRPIKVGCGIIAWVTIALIVSVLLYAGFRWLTS